MAMQVLTGRYKVVVVGLPGVGKTAYIEQLRSGCFIEDYNPTVESGGVIVTDIVLYCDGLDITFELWEINNSDEDAVFKDAHGVLVMHDGTRPETLDFPLKVISEHKNICTILCCNKNDCQDYSVKLASAFSQNYVSAYTISAKTKYGIYAPFANFARQFNADPTLVVYGCRQVNTSVLYNVVHPVSMVKTPKPKKVILTESVMESIGSELCVAAKDCKIAEMEILHEFLSAGLDPNLPLKLNTALYEAASYDQLAAIDALHKWGALDVNKPLAIAAGNGNITIMRHLKKLGAKAYNQALRAAASGDSIEAIQELVKWGATKFDRALRAAAYRNNIRSMEMLIGLGATDFSGALRSAVEEEGNCNYDAIQLLLSKFPDDSSDGEENS